MDFRNLDFTDIEKNVYGGNIEEDEELLAELAAIQDEELGKKRRTQVPAPNQVRQRNVVSDVPGVDPKALAAALNDKECDVDDDVLEQDSELLGELAGLVGEETHTPPDAPSSSSNHQTIPPATSERDEEMITRLRQLHSVYSKMLATAEKGGEGAKARRYKRSVEKLTELIRNAERGKKINPSDIPVAPPNFDSIVAPLETVAHPAQLSGSERREMCMADSPPVPERKSSTAPPIPERKSIQPPPVPERKPAPEANPKMDEISDPKKKEIFSILKRRRDMYVANGKAAIAVHDKVAAKEFVSISKAFDQAISALATVSADELDLSEIPPTPPPYRKASKPPQEEKRERPQHVDQAASQNKPLTFIDALEQRRMRYLKMAEKAKQDGNDRKIRMNTRLAGQYADAIKEAKAGRPVAIAELPTLPDMPPLPPQSSQPNQTVSRAKEPQPAASTGKMPTERAVNSNQLSFLVQRQTEFKQAALHAKNRGDIDKAKQYLIEAKGFDKMIQAARAGLPVSIKQTPIPPQSTTAATTLQPKIQPSSSSSTGLENRGERLSLMEKTLIEQVRLAESNKIRFTRLGDVGKVRQFEGWAKLSKQDLLLVRAVAQQGLNLPKFHYEMRHIPSADLFPDLAEDVIELTLLSCRDVPLPSGYEPHHANLFVKYCFPFPTDNPQSGKTKHVAGTTSPEFNETIMLQIGSGKSRNSKLQRAFKRGGLRFEVYQKGGFMRSDKLLGSCEWKLDKLETTAEMEESLPLKDGRKAVGGLASARVRIREPIGDAKAQTQAHKWLVLDN